MAGTTSPFTLAMAKTKIPTSRISLPISAPTIVASRAAVRPARTTGARATSECVSTRVGLVKSPMADPVGGSHTVSTPPASAVRASRPRSAKGTETTGARFGWTPPANLAELVRWADIIDAARFASAAEATSLAAPAQRLALWLGSADDAAIGGYIAALVDGATLAELAAGATIGPAIEALRATRADDRAAIAAAALPVDVRVVIDLADRMGAPAIGFPHDALVPCMARESNG